jgi:membrane protease YdiL (CAAX protease family)
VLSFSWSFSKWCWPLFYAAAYSEHLLSEFDIMSLFRGGSDLAMQGVLVGIGAALSEEMLWRGLLLSALAQSRLGFWGAALVSTALWVASHDRLWGLPLGLTQALLLLLEFSALFLKGIFFSWLLWRTGSLRPAILCHALDDFLHLSVRF